MYDVREECEKLSLVRLFDTELEEKIDECVDKEKITDYI